MVDHQVLPHRYRPVLHAAAAIPVGSWAVVVMSNPPRRRGVFGDRETAFTRAVVVGGALGVAVVVVYRTAARMAVYDPDGLKIGEVLN